MSRILLIVLLVANVYCVLCEPLVEVCHGSISGVTLRTRNGREISAFLGIPYAEPPIGDLRFRDPVPKRQWNGTLNAQTEGAPCVQLGENGVVGSENCLVLNVFTPKPKADKLLPVMVFIHGGGYVFGNSDKLYYGPNYLLDKDVVLVTLNYRLAVFGFLSTGDDAAPGNFGLKDQLLAMKWVKRNIHAFGGDSNRITLFGESAGSSSVHLHSLSKKSKRYFNNYIMQSGVALCPWAFHSNPSYYEFAKKFAKQHNCPITDSHKLVNCLRRLPATQMLDSSVFSPLEQIFLGTWGPTIERPSNNAFITESPINLLQKNEMKMSPLISGNCRDEGLTMTKSSYVNSTLFNMLLSNSVSIIEEILQRSELPLRAKNLTALAIKVKNFYLGDEARVSRHRLLQGFTDLITDITFVYPQTYILKYLNENVKQSTYGYLFNYRGTVSYTLEVTTENLGVSHADDLVYLFPITSKNVNPAVDYTQTSADLKISELMVDLWTSFANTSVPMSNRLTSLWQPRGEGNIYLQIGSNTSTQVTFQSQFFKERMNFMDEVYSCSTV